VELVCPAGNLPSLKAAVDNGADAVYIGFKDETNARHFAGLNFNNKQIEQGLDHARARGTKVYVAINTYPQPGTFAKWETAVDQAAGYGVDALIVADIGVMDYAAENWPELRLHLSVQGSATSHEPELRLHLSVQGSATSHEAVRFFAEQFGVQRAIAPRVLSVKQVASLVDHSPIPIEVFGFGSLCVMVEGRCYLSSYVTGQGPNTFGACSPASFVRWSETDSKLETRLNGVLIDRVNKDENAGYPTICKGRFRVNGKTSYAIERPTSLNTLPILPDLLRIGVAAIKIEGRQRSPSYVATVTKVLRAAIDSCIRDPENFLPEHAWMSQLTSLSERTWQ
jgi:putative protease